MIGKKRGMLLLLLVIALLVFSVDVIAASLPVNREMYVAIGGRYDESGDENSCDNSDVSINRLAPKGTEPDWHGDNFWNKCKSYSDCQIPPEKGCWFLVTEVDDLLWNNNDVAWLWSHFGEYFYYGKYHDPGEGNQYDSGGDSDGNNDGKDCVLDYDFKYHNALICASDGYWHECVGDGGEEGEDGTLGTIAWVMGTIEGETPTTEYIYNCTLEKDTDMPIWQIINVDADYDGYTSDVDCDDKVNDDGSTTECPMLDESTGEIPCLYPEHSKCAICINPGAPETCGDGVDNNCNEIIETCNNFKEGCTNSAISEDVLEDGAWPTEHYNIYGDDISFPWVQTNANGDGFCCGFNGTNDLGKIVTGKGSDSGEFVCLSRNPDLTGGEVEIPGGETYCKGEWCLSNAVGGPSAGGKFTIFTVKPLGESPYDIVSNGQSWLICDANSSGEFKEYPDYGVDPNEELDSGGVKAIVNRFYCYNEGDHYAWAECADISTDRKNLGVKGRYPGDGLYSLPLSVNEEEGGISSAGYHEIAINIFNNYVDFYGEKYYLDFSGYKHLNFMVQFCQEGCTETEVLTLEELKDGDFLPLNIELSLIGSEIDSDNEPTDLVLFNKQVMGDVTNSPQFGPETWLHIKTEIPENIKGVKTILFDTEEPAKMRIRNVYLSKDEPETLLCSGKYAEDESSWLTDMDQGGSKEDITGKELCTALYGTNAWLGKDNQINTAYQGANCCGDDSNEYYAGPSMGEEEERFGCWNSETIKDKETSMTVEFEVKYEENIIDFTYDKEQITENLEMNFNIKYKGCIDELIDYVDGDAVIETDCEIYETVKSRSIDVSNIGEGKFYLQEYIEEQFSSIRTDLIYAIIGDYDDISVYVEDIDLEITNINPANNIYLFDTIDSENLGTEAQVNLIGDVVLVIEQGETAIPNPSTNLNTSIYSYSCSDKECLYPLPGDPLLERTIKNLHPELYDLYFVSYNEADEKIEYELIKGKETFSKPGNVLATKVPQQIMFIADDIDSTFYGCQVADYVLNNNKANPFLEDQPHCSIQGNQFCAPSDRVSALSGQDQYTLVNSWSSEEVSEVGYFEEGEDSTFDDFETYFDSLTLQLKPPNTIIEAKDRNYTTSVVPFRNIIPNAEFENSGGEIPHWEILKKDKVVDSEKGYWDENTKGLIKKLKSNEDLRSEKIAINQTGTYYISNNGTADIDIYDDENKKVPINNDGTFEPNSQFIIVEFSKGTVYQPFLQLVDDFGPGEYNYKYQTYPDEYYFRSGLSCCKPNQCWNGYTCVEPMENVALMTEHFGLGKDYRCIDGQWTHLPVKWDWNNQKWGFCTQEEQCFVTKKGLAGNTISSFLDQGKAPICINPGESVLDHYCQDGAWTSRTKFLASKLVEVAGNDEFILYCTHYKDSLLDYGHENYLGGESQEESDELPGLGEESVGIAQDSELSYTCFPDLWGAEDSKDLVAQDENTCINNMCVLRYTEGGQFKTAFATTLNKNISDTANSFLLGFDVPQEELNTICAGEDDFVKCNFDGADMWYSKELNAIVYGKEGISLTPGLGEQLIDWLKGLVGMGTDLPEFEQFVFGASNFNEIYLLDKEGKKAKVVREFVNGSDVQQQSILAEYEGFTTPICEYVNNLALPEELDPELLLTVEGYSKYNCTSEAGKQKLQIIVNQDESKGLDYFWPQLTGKLRVGSFD